MKSIHSCTALLAALAVPLTTLAQDVHTVVTMVVVTTNAIGSPPVGSTPIEPIPTPSSSTTSTPNAVIATPSASGSHSGSGSSKASTGGSTATGLNFTLGTCQGEGMKIYWTGDVVPFYVEGGASGQTTGCTVLGTNFNGQIAIDQYGGTIFEGNYGSEGQYFDISFIIGYSVPAIAASKEGASGCSIAMHEQGVDCPQPGAGSVCTNPVGSNGTATPGMYNDNMYEFPWCLACSAPHEFFQPCAGSGYAYPYDDAATIYAAADETITICIGTTCGSTGKEGSTKNGHAEPSRAESPCGLCSATASSAPAASAKPKRDEGALEQERERRKRHAHAHAHGNGHL